MGEHLTSRTGIFGRALRPGLLLPVVGGLAALAWLWYTCVRSPEVSFLAQRGGAEWIIYPTPAQAKAHSRVELNTAFRYRFNLSHAPVEALLQVAAFRHYALSLNGTRLAPSYRAPMWKEPDWLDVAKQLHAGENEIAVNVFNSNGPPCLWLSLQTGRKKVLTDESWEASYAGASWHSARLASRPMQITTGSELAGGDSTWRGIRKCWPALLVLTLLSAAAWRAVHARWFADKDNSLLLWALAAGWVLLFANNLGVLPNLYGFDAQAHMDYVRYIMEHKALPLANQGYEMFQPPLYYVVCALLLKSCHLSLPHPGAVALLRAFGMAVGIAHFSIVWASLRLLLPEERTAARWGALFAGALPMLVYLSHYVTNEALAAACASGCVFLCLRMLKREKVLWGDYALLGGCLGVALLAKATSLLVMPPILGALLWRSFSLTRGRPDARPMLAKLAAGLCLTLVACVAICGFHYFRMWKHFGSPLVGNWDPRLGSSYWLDEGYRTASFFLRFGASLTSPWFCALNGFADGIYSTLFGDSLMAGTAEFVYRPPWNYELMSAGYWLAILPTILAGIGAVLAVRKFAREPRPEWFLILGLGFMGVLALVHMMLVVPQWSMVKAFYILCALTPFSAFIGSGMAWLSSRSVKLRPLLSIGFALWAVTSLAAFWIPRGSTRVTLAEAHALRGSAGFEQAAALLKGALDKQPADAELRMLLADTLFRLGRPDAARENAEVVLRNKPDAIGARRVRGLLLYAAGKSTEAMEDFRRCVQLEPGHGDYWLSLARLFVEQGNFDEAARAARDGLAADPYNAHLHYYLAMAWHARGATEAAVPQFLLACRLNPGWATPRSALGGLRLAQGRFEEAANHYTAAVALAPNEPALKVQLGRALLLRGQLRDATEQFNAALRLEPTNALAHCQLALALEKQGDASGALAHLTEALRLEPAMTEAATNLTRMKGAEGP